MILRWRKKMKKALCFATASMIGMLSFCTAERVQAKDPVYNISRDDEGDAAESEYEEYRTIDFLYDGIGYHILEDGTVALTNGDAASGEFEIPEQVEYNGRSYPVTKVEGGSLLEE